MTVRPEGTESRPDASFPQEPPQISLPRGGGSIRGIGEKFSANPVTGTGSLSVPIATSPGRAGFGPALTLSYDSGAGNGPFGLGWRLSLPAITRKTDKGVPRYRDSAQSDVFILAGAEDLVPVLAANGERPEPEELVVYGSVYLVCAYRPRVESAFALIERWTERRRPSNMFWRTVSRDNVTTWFGRSPESRVADPADPTRIFEWFPTEQSDDRGNVIRFDYKREDAANIDISTLAEANRENAQRTANTYLRRVRYGNLAPYMPTLASTGTRWPTPEDEPGQQWMFEAVFDYGDHPGMAPATQPAAAWSSRRDPFSVHRAGFEVRTYRLCRRVLMFHHFEAELGAADYLVRSTDFTYAEPDDLTNPERAGYTVLTSVTQRAYQKRAPTDDVYESRQSPPLSLSYSSAEVDITPRSLARSQLENLPVGTQGPGYRWVDLDGEGLPGVLTEQAGSWHYKPNVGDGNFGPMRPLASRPAFAALASGQQLMDLGGDGELDLVELSGPVAGFHERDGAAGWKRFVPFAALPQIDWTDRNLRFVDLTGDGLADVLITEDDVFTWYPTLGEEGFGAGKRALKAGTEERGPRLVFADGTQTILLADMTGDGLTDFVRVRNRDVSYWPNLGYGSFGRKVSLANAPQFDHDELYDPRRIRLGDIDGSGPADIVYLGRDRARIYFNRSGNSLSSPLEVNLPVATQNLDAVQLADLFGNGTACLVWNSALPGDAGRPVRYIDLMGGSGATARHGKPHLLIGVDNNLGSTTEIEYSPSTRFYLEDRRLGRPWITRLPFPVHCVRRITLRDRWRGTTFSSKFSYHHGYFDGVEREFRGFGRVEQVDAEDYGATRVSSPYVTSDKRLHQPPVKTITWYHTGAALDRQRILSQFEAEYFPARYPFSGAFREKPLAEPVLPADLTSEEWREALRACKGMVLRQEVYELELRDLAGPVSRETPVRIFSAAAHDCRIGVLQRRGVNRHAVFQVLEGEALSYQYELALPREPAAVAPDPRVTQTINLRHDEQGNLLQSITVAYGRWQPGDYATLPRAAVIASVQAEQHLSYAEARYTEDVIEPPRIPGTQRAIRHRRLRLPCEALTYELKGIAAANGDYFEREDFVALDLSEIHGHRPGETAPARSVELKQYHEWADGQRAQKRLVERARTLYFDDASDTSAPVRAAAFGRHGPRALKYETYKLALTDALLDAVYKQRDAAGTVVDDKLRWVVEPGAGGAPAVVASDLLDRPVAPASPYLASGYILGSGLDAAFNGQYWMRSGTAGFASDAQRHFFIPERYTDAFGNVTTLQRDARDLYVMASTDARGNSVSVERFDYRVLAAQRMRDINANVSAVAFDIRGLPAAAAQMGKITNAAQPATGESGDDVDDLSFDLLNPPPEAVATFLSTDYSGRAVRRWLGKATSRFVYHFGETVDAQGALVWLASPPAAVGIVRERHERDLPNVDSPDDAQLLPVQVAAEYSDGGGAVLLKKSQAEADPTDTREPPPLRWIASGKTILNNKGRPVKQFEPYFSATEHRFDATEAEREVGVTPLLFYDAPGRLVRTELPDGTLTRAEFSPWHVANYDANDTVLESRWYTERNAPDAADPEPADHATRAAWLSAQHANTPALVLLDSLGRSVIAIAHNRAPDANGAWQDARYATFTKLDAEGKPLWVRDARGNLVTQYVFPNKPTQLANDAAGEDQPATSVPCYDIAGNLLYLHGMDSGDRWTLTDGAGKPMLAWDINERTLDDGSTLVERRLYTTAHDELHRPVAMWLGINGGARSLIEAFEYLDTDSFRDAAGNLDQAGLDAARANNLLAHAISHYDSSGRMSVERFDFKGALEEETRTLVSDVTSAVVDWSVPNRSTLLENETFRRIAEHDALGRMTRLFNWHRDTTLGIPTPGQSDRVAVYVPRYSVRGLLEGERLYVRARKVTTNGRVDFVPSAAAARNVDAIRRIEWDIKGRRSRMELGNGTVTHYSYDATTFRLTRLYTRRDARFAADCGGPPPPPRSAAPDTDNAPRSCGVQNLRYTYDAVGNLTRLQDDAQDIIWFANTQVDASCDYTYDALYRLIRATGRENTAAQAPPPHAEGDWPIGPMPSIDAVNRYLQSYVYDEVGNFVEMKHRASRQAGQPSGDWTRHYSVSADSNRLVRTWYGNNVNDAVDYRYDMHGSMRNLANSAPTLDMRWDHRDMVRALDLQGGGMAYYSYGADKERSRKLLVRNPTAAHGGTFREDRIYLGGYELYRRHTGDPADPVEEIESHHLSAGQQRVLLVDDVIRTRKPRPDGANVRAQTLFRYQYCTHLGSTSTELDGDAEIISYEEFHPYGGSAYRAMNSAVEAAPKRYRFAGLERDEESSLLYSVARYFTAGLGRWLSCDPGGFVDGFNLYAYARNSPVVHADVNGREVVVATGAVVAVAAETGGLPAAGAVSTWSATVANFSGGAVSATAAPVSGAASASGTMLPAVAAAPSASAGATVSTGAGLGLGAAAVGLIIVAVLAVPTMIVLGLSDAADRSQRYEAEAAIRHEKYLDSLKQEPYVATEAQKEASKGLADQLLGRGAGKGPAHLPGADHQKGPAVAPGADHGKGPKIAPSHDAGKGPISAPGADHAKGPVTLPSPETPGGPKVLELAKGKQSTAGPEHWTDQEHQSAEKIRQRNNSLVFEQAELFIELPSGKFQKVPGVRFDAIEIMQDGTIILHEFTTAKELDHGARKQAQIKRMRDALLNANLNGQTIVARPQGSRMVYDVNTATCYIGTYPHWRQSQQTSRYGPGY